MTIKLTYGNDAIAEWVKSVSNIKLGTAFFDKVGTIVAADIIGNIESGTQADGSPIKSNSPSTRKKKQRRGNSPTRSLIDIERRFIRRGKSSWAWTPTSKSVTVKPTGVGQREPLSWLVPEVQKKGYVGWFGISKKGEAAIRKVFMKKLKKLLKSRR